MMRYFRRAAMVLVLASSTWATSALAQSESESVFAQWMDDLRQWGAKDVSFRSADYVPSADRLYVRDLSFTVPINLTIGQGAGFTASISLSSSLVVFDGLARSSDGYQVARLEAANGTRFGWSFNAGVSQKVEYVIDGYVLENAGWPSLPAISTDPSRPISRYYPVVRWFKGWRAEKNTIARATANQSDSNQMTATTTYTNMVVDDMADGLIRKFKVDTMTMDMTMLIAGEGKKNITITVGEQFGSDYDFGGFIDAFDPENLPSSANASKATNVIGLFELRDLSMNFDGMVDIDIARMAIEGWSVRPIKAGLLAMVDRAVSGNEPSEEEIIQAMISLVNIYNFELFEVEGVDVRAPENTGGKLRSVRLANVSRDGFSEFAIEGLSISGPGKIAGNLAGFFIEDVEFPAMAAILALANLEKSGRKPSPREILNVVPMIGRIDLADLAVTDPKGREVTLKGYRNEMSGHIPPIPTSIRVMIERLRVAVDLIEDKEAKQQLQALGLTHLVMSESLSIRWDEKSGDLILEDFSVSMENGGEITLKAVLTGVPRSVFEDPQSAAGALATLAIKSIVAEYRDDSLANQLLKIQAAKMGITADQFRAQVAASVPAMLAQINNPEFASRINPEIAAFIENPGSLRVTANPPNPVPVTQIMGAMMAPQTIPDLLAVTVKANSE